MTEENLEKVVAVVDKLGAVLAELNLILMPCPFCGGNVSIVITDDEGNLRDLEYEHDPFRGISYRPAHCADDNCPIPNQEDECLGQSIYDTRVEAIAAWNRRVSMVSARGDTGSL